MSQSLLLNLELTCSPPGTCRSPQLSSKHASAPSFYMGAGIKFKSSSLHGRHFPALASMFLTSLLYYFMTLPYFYISALMGSSRAYPWPFLVFTLYALILYCGTRKFKPFTSSKNTVWACAHHSPIYCIYITIFKLVLAVYNVPTHKPWSLSQIRFLSSQHFVFPRVKHWLVFLLIFYRSLIYPSSLSHHEFPTNMTRYIIQCTQYIQ